MLNSWYMAAAMLAVLGSGPAAVADASSEERLSQEFARLEASRETGAVVAFWREAGPSMWFAKDPAFDKRFRERFADRYAKAARGELRDWLSAPEGALVVDLDHRPVDERLEPADLHAPDLHRARRRTERAAA